MHIYELFNQITFKLQQAVILWPLIRSTVKHYPYLLYFSAKYFAAAAIVLGFAILAFAFPPQMMPEKYHASVSNNFSVSVRTAFVHESKASVESFISNNNSAASHLVWQDLNAFEPNLVILPKMILTIFLFAFVRLTARFKHNRYISMIERLAAADGRFVWQNFIACARTLILSLGLKLQICAQVLFLAQRLQSGAVLVFKK